MKYYFKMILKRIQVADYKKDAATGLHSDIVLECRIFLSHCVTQRSSSGRLRGEQRPIVIPSNNAIGDNVEDIRCLACSDKKDSLIRRDSPKNTVVIHDCYIMRCNSQVNLPILGLFLICIGLATACTSALAQYLRERQ